MTISSFRIFALAVLFAVFWLPPARADTPAPTHDENAEVVDESAPAVAAAPDDAKAMPPAPPEDNIQTRTERAIQRATVERHAINPNSTAKPVKVPLGSLTMRQSAVRLDQISLWRDDVAKDADDKPVKAEDKAAPTDVWDGADATDVTAILPALAAAKSQRIKDITLRIAMSGVYTPAGMNDMDYVHWRADILMAQKHPELAARLYNTARLGRSENADATRRIGYEIAAGKVEAACVESMAGSADALQPFWQGMQILCARHLGDVAAAKNLTAALPDGAIKTAAGANDNGALTDAVIKAANITPAVVNIPDNTEILEKLKQLLADIQGADDPKLAAKQNKGELLLLSLGAWRAEKHADTTDELTERAMPLAGFPN